MSEQQAEYVTEAMELLNGEPAAEIHPPKTIKVLSDAGLIDYKVWGWVKTSTQFIYHIKKLKGAKLAIWQVVSLMIDEDGECKLTIAEIAELAGYSYSETHASLAELDRMNYLSIDKTSGRKSMYAPSFVARGANQPTDHPSRKTIGTSKLPLQSPLLSSAPDPSSPSIEKAHSSIIELKRVNSNPSQKKDPVDGIIHYQLKPKGIRDAIANHFRLTPNWEAKYNRQFLEWSVEVDMTPEQIENAADLWRMDKRFNWSVPTLKGIQEHWLELIGTPSIDDGWKRDKNGEYVRDEITGEKIPNIAEHLLSY